MTQKMRTSPVISQGPRCGHESARSAVLAYRYFGTYGFIVCGILHAGALLGLVDHSATVTSSLYEKGGGGISSLGPLDPCTPEQRDLGRSRSVCPYGHAPWCFRAHVHAAHSVAPQWYVFTSHAVAHLEIHGIRGIVLPAGDCFEPDESKPDGSSPSISACPNETARP